MHLVCTQMLIQTLQLHYIIEMFQNSHVEFIQEQLEVNRKIWGISESSWNWVINHIYLECSTQQPNCLQSTVHQHAYPYFSSSAVLGSTCGRPWVWHSIGCLLPLQNIGLGAPISVKETARSCRVQDLVNKVSVAWLWYSSLPGILTMSWLCDFDHCHGAGSIHHTTFLAIFFSCCSTNMRASERSKWHSQLTLQAGIIDMWCQHWKTWSAWPWSSTSWLLTYFWWWWGVSFWWMCFGFGVVG